MGDNIYLNAGKKAIQGNWFGVRKDMGNEVKTAGNGLTRNAGDAISDGLNGVVRDIGGAIGTFFRGGKAEEIVQGGVETGRQILQGGTPAVTEAVQGGVAAGRRAARGVVERLPEPGQVGREAAAAGTGIWDGLKQKAAGVAVAVGQIFTPAPAAEAEAEAEVPVVDMGTYTPAARAAAEARSKVEAEARAKAEADALRNQPIVPHVETADAKAVHLPNLPEGQPLESAKGISSLDQAITAEKVGLKVKESNPNGFDFDDLKLNITPGSVTPAKLEGGGFALPHAHLEGAKFAQLETPASTVSTTPIVKTNVDPTAEFARASAEQQGPAAAAAPVKPSATTALDTMIDATTDAGRLDTLTRARYQVSKIEPSGPAGMG